MSQFHSRSSFTYSHIVTTTTVVVVITTTLSPTANAKPLGTPSSSRSYGCISLLKHKKQADKNNTNKNTVATSWHLCAREEKYAERAPAAWCVTLHIPLIHHAWHRAECGGERHSERQKQHTKCG